MAISDKAKKITNLIYMAYASDSGILLGIPPELRMSIEAIVKATLNMADSVSDKDDD